MSRPHPDAPRPLVRQTPATVDVWVARGLHWWHCNACNRTSRKGYGHIGTAEGYGNTHYRAKHRSSGKR